MRAVLRFALARLFAGSPRDRRREPVNGHGPNRRGLALALRALKREEEGVLSQVMLPPALVRAIVCRVCGVGWTDIVADVVHTGQEGPARRPRQFGALRFAQPGALGVHGERGEHCECCARGVPGHGPIHDQHTAAAGELDLP